jgi:hypothetical protein
MVEVKNALRSIKAGKIVKLDGIPNEGLEVLE